MPIYEFAPVNLIRTAQQAQGLIRYKNVVSPSAHNHLESIERPKARFRRVLNTGADVEGG